MITNNPLMESALTVFSVIAVGIMTARIVGGRWVDVLNNYAFNIAVPALLIVSFWRYELLKAEMEFVPLTYLSLAACSVLSYLLFRLMGFSDLPILVLASVLGNVAYLGIPLVELAFGEEYLGLVGLLSVVHFSILPVFIAIIEGKISLETLKSPLIISAFIGLALSLGGLPRENFVYRALDLISSSASPVALFSIGLWIGSRGITLGGKEVYVLTFLKLVVLPLVLHVAYLTHVFRISGDAYVVSLVEASTPLAIANFIVAKKYEKHVDTISSAIVVSTALSLVTIPAVVTLLG